MFRGSVGRRSLRSPFEHAAAAAVLLRERLVDRISVEYAGEADEELLDEVELLLLPRLLRLRLEVAPLPLQLDGGRRHAARVAPAMAVLQVGRSFFQCCREMSCAEQKKKSQICKIAKEA